MPKPIDPLRDFTVGACVMRFFLGLFFGVLLDGMIVGAWLALRSPVLIPVPLFAWTLGCIPLVWGILSMFWLEPMTEFVRASWEQGPSILAWFCPRWLYRGRWKP